MAAPETAREALSNRPVLITGGSGFVGRAVVARLPEAIAISSSDLQLTDGPSVAKAIADWQPRVVIHLAARVGGITANLTKPADFLLDNLRIDANVLAALRTHPPAHLISMLSTCMYPDDVPLSLYPMSEDLLEAGPPPPSNAAYAVAKRALWHGTLALFQQYGCHYSAIVAANLYGPGDHFGDPGSHFLAAAVDKIERARIAKKERIEFFGTGRALRQYVFVEDVADLIGHLVRRGPLDETVNVSPMTNHSIRDLAQLVADAAAYEGEIVFSGEGPDGQYRKDANPARLLKLVPEWRDLETPLTEGLRHTIDWYRTHVAAG